MYTYTCTLMHCTLSHTCTSIVYVIESIPNYHSTKLQSMNRCVPDHLPAYTSTCTFEVIHMYMYIVNVNQTLLATRMLVEDIVASKYSHILTSDSLDALSSSLTVSMETSSSSLFLERVASSCLILAALWSSSIFISLLSSTRLFSCSFVASS